MIGYCFEVTAYWAVSYAFYALLLRQLTFFTLNRFFIVTNLVLGLLWPLMLVETRHTGTTTEVLLPMVQVSGQVLRTIEAETAHMPSNLRWMLVGLYSLISCAVAYRLAVSVYKIWRLKQLAIKREVQDDLIVLYSQSVSAPFSFCSYLFLPVHIDFSEYELAQIMAHERCHIREMHSLDILLCEVLRVFFWWNPFVQLWKQALSDQHEYLADQAVLQNYTPQEYGHFLLRQLQVCTPAGPVHSIFQSPIKKRICMMISPFTATTQVARYFLFLPLVFCTHILAVQAQTTKNKSTTSSRHAPVAVIDTVITIDPKNYAESVKIVQSEHYESADVPPVYGNCASGSTADQLQECSIANLMQFLVANLQYPDAARKAGVQGKALVSFIVDEQGHVERPYIKRSLGDEIDAEVLRVVGRMDTWTPAKVNGKAVRFKYTLPVMFKL